MRFVSRCRPVMGAMALVGMLALAGCAPQPAPPSPSATTAMDAPVFASDAEALAAATAAYAAYLQTIDAVLANGGREVSPLSDVAVGDALSAEVGTAQNYAEKEYRSVGSTTFDSVQIQAITDDGSGNVLVSTYLCSDLSNVDVLEKGGTSIVPADRVDRFPLQVVFQNSQVASPGLKISSSVTWTGTNFC
ncbi:hypothetical protein QMG61_04930 [Cryobacterium sp. PH31-AA6]|uniref:hypothetical protein n=1 Tax=Cryobacterium sp. PH31-AA6 TaxID=3046205 RepID=UPI0024BB4240|nr:hypothetical protein [Cryobacterium sp. PH31-AA6]MDJ0323106.1 hypothetical protein [Cryobacterium sp. PH31-AA6]